MKSCSLSRVLFRNRIKTIFELVICIRVEIEKYNIEFSDIKVFQKIAIGNTTGNRVNSKDIQK